MQSTEQYLPLSRVVYHVLLSLSQDTRHGYGVIKHVSAVTSGAIELETGTLYAAIRRLRQDGLLDEAPAPAGADARRRYYELTDLGRAVLRAESERLAQLVEMARAARVLPQPGR